MAIPKVVMDVLFESLKWHRDTLLKFEQELKELKTSRYDVNKEIEEMESNIRDITDFKKTVDDSEISSIFRGKVLSLQRKVETKISYLASIDSTIKDILGGISNQNYNIKKIEEFVEKYGKD